MAGLSKKSVFSKINRDRSSIAIMTLIALAFFVGSSFAHLEKISFDEGSRSNFTDCSNISWYLDRYDGHDASPSLHSGMIQSGGKSCISKEVTGPADVEFWWKVNQYSNRVGDLLFLIDDKTILECQASNWAYAACSIPNGSHTIKWEYRKVHSYPEYEGAGWIDDISINYLGITWPTYITPGEMVSSDYFGSINETLDDMDQRISKVEGMNDTVQEMGSRIDMINASLDDVKSSLENESNQTHVHFSGIDQTLDDMQGRISKAEGMNEHVQEMDNRINEINTSFDDVKYSLENESNQTRIRFDGIDQNIAVIESSLKNISLKNITFLPSGLALTEDNTIIISPESNISEVLNRQDKKIFLFEDGIYHTNNLTIKGTDKYLQPIHFGAALIDAGSSDHGILIENATNITINSMDISNGITGIYLNNCSNCKITNNIILEFTMWGIYVNNSHDCTVGANKIESYRNSEIVGIGVYYSYNNIFIDNVFELKDFRDYNRTNIYELNQSYGNNIYIYKPQECWVMDDDVKCNIKSEYYCGFNKTNTTTKIDLAKYTRNYWSFLETYPYHEGS